MEQPAGASASVCTRSGALERLEKFFWEQNRIAFFEYLEQHRDMRSSTEFLCFQNGQLANRGSTYNEARLPGFGFVGQPATALAPRPAGAVDGCFFVTCSSVPHETTQLARIEAVVGHHPQTKTGEQYILDQISQSVRLGMQWEPREIEDALQQAKGRSQPLACELIVDTVATHTLQVPRTQLPKQHVDLATPFQNKPVQLTLYDATVRIDQRAHAVQVCEGLDSFCVLGRSVLRWMDLHWRGEEGCTLSDLPSSS